ncbi:MAG TPA: hypothetical protein VHV30_01425 [Polyangiaceae bacterium]|jgi:hypothetical protein|nr:hypothetical protein [Polyangiaceae bacterium]
MKAPNKSPRSPTPPVPLQRRDATGHLNPRYAADLRRKSRESSRPNGDVAFLGRARSSDSLAEVFGEAFVAAATAGEGAARSDAFHEAVPEDAGGPFIITKGKHEFAREPDPSNPPEATREPFPTALSADDDDGLS